MQRTLKNIIVTNFNYFRSHGKVIKTKFVLRTKLINVLNITGCFIVSPLILTQKYRWSHERRDMLFTILYSCAVANKEKIYRFQHLEIELKDIQFII